VREFSHGRSGVAATLDFCHPCPSFPAHVYGAALSRIP
jgi:hypothetical protein